MNGYKNLVVAVIWQAIKDWKEYPNMRRSISRFLKSEWGKSLCEYINLDSNVILNRLKNGKIMYKKAKKRTKTLNTHNEELCLSCN